MKRTFSVAARLQSFVYAGRGVKTLLASQHNAWIHALSTVMVVVGGVAAKLTRFEWLALIVAIVSVWMAEALNTAFEFLCDVASPGFHPLVARAKDVAAAAVLICVVGASRRARRSVAERKIVDQKMAVAAAVGGKAEGRDGRAILRQAALVALQAE